jgi:predicted negative regulator of RcsB-dependent stress response
VDNATKRHLKQPDQFVATTEHGLEWVSQNRKSALVWALAVVGAILVAVGGWTFYQHRTDQASTAFGEAMQTYQTPLQNAEQPIPPGMKSFPDAKTRAAAANAQFLSVASQYGLTQPGKLAKYFAGLTYVDEGQNDKAAATLREVSTSWNGNLAALAKLALAQLDQQTGNYTEAANLYNELAKTNASSVPAGLAQIQLGEMYQSQGKIEEARKVFAAVKDKDKGPKGQLGPAGEVASEKLNPQPAAAMPGMPQ